MDEKQFEETVKRFNEMSSTELIEQLNANDEKVVFIGRPTCPYCRAYLPKLVEAADADNLDIYYVNSIDANDEVLSDFRFKVGAKTVPSTVRVGGKEQYKNLNLESDATVTEIREAISQA